MEPGLRERKKLQTRDALARAALELAAEHGLENVTVDQISATANVSPRTFFNYFSGKEEAIAGVGEDGAERLCDAIRAVPADLPALEAVRSALRGEAVRLQEDPRHLRLQMAVVERSPGVWPHLVASGERSLGAVAGAVAERVGVDPTTHPFPRLLAATAGGVFRMCVLQWHAAGTGTSLTDLVDQAFVALAAGLPDPDRP